MGDESKLPPIARLFLALKENGIRFQIAGMTAGLLQGVPSTTLDTDIWIDLPERKYVAVLAICQKLNSTILAKTVVALEDDLLVNFLYRVDGVGSFNLEWNKAKELELYGQTIKILSLRSLLKSKMFLKRDKDLAHIPILKEVIRRLKKS